MLTVSNSIKQAYNRYTTQRKSYIRVGNNSFFIQNLDVSADAYYEGNVIGNAIAKIAKFDIETVNVNSIDEFELFDGIWTGNQYEYISLGTFKLFNEEGTDDFFSSVTAYDKLVLFNKEYDFTQTTYPTTLYGLLQNICSQAGVELKNTFIPNGNQPLPNNLFVENETLKNVLNAICQISGNYAIITNDKLKLLLKGTETIKLNKSQISNPEYKRTTWKINQVVLGMSDVEGEYVLRQDDADVEKNGVHKLVINDNPFVYTQALRELYIDNLFNQVKGFGYTAFETAWEGLSYVELGDLLNIDGKESIVLRYNLKSPQGLNSTLSAPSIIDSVVEYIDNSNSIKNKQKKTELKVDKQGQAIEQLIIDSSESNEKVTKIEQTIDGIKMTTTEVQKKLENDYLTTNEISNVINQTIYETTNLISQTGGSNLLKNTQFYQNADEWDKSENIEFEVITGSIDVEQNTTNKSELLLKNGILTQNFSMNEGKNYTITFKYKKEALNNRISRVRIYRTDNTYEEIFNTNEVQPSRKEFSYTFIATVNTAKLEIYTDNDDFSINDLIIQSGTSTEWSPNSTETRGLGHKLSGNALELYDLGSSGEKAILDYNNLVFEQNSTFKAEYGSNSMQTNNAIINQSAKLCGLIYTKVDDDNVIVN